MKHPTDNIFIPLLSLTNQELKSVKDYNIQINSYSENELIRHRLDCLIINKNLEVFMALTPHSDDFDIERFRLVQNIVIEYYSAILTKSWTDALIRQFNSLHFLYKEERNLFIDNELGQYYRIISPDSNLDDLVEVATLFSRDFIDHFWRASLVKPIYLSVDYQLILKANFCKSCNPKEIDWRTFLDTELILLPNSQRPNSSNDIVERLKEAMPGFDPAYFESLREQIFNPQKTITDPSKIEHNCAISALRKYGVFLDQQRKYPFHKRKPKSYEMELDISINVNEFIHCLLTKKVFNKHSVPSLKNALRGVAVTEHIPIRCKEKAFLTMFFELWEARKLRVTKTFLAKWISKTFSSNGDPISASYASKVLSKETDRVNAFIDFPKNSKVNKDYIDISNFLG